MNQISPTITPSPPTFSSGADWRDRVHLGMRCAGLLAQHSVKSEVPTFSETDFVDFLTSLVAEGKSQSLPVHDAPKTSSEVSPRLNKELIYLIITLNAVSRGGLTMSMPFGGIAFEDPFWATLAARNIASGHPLAVLPVASSSEELWSRSTLHGKALGQIESDGHASFENAVRFIPPDSKPIFILRQIEGSRLELLRQKGRCILPQASAGAVFQLYTPPIYSAEV
jgi:hypothetical protein